METSTATSNTSIAIGVGAHYDPDAGQACVMEWVAIAAGEEFSDRPACVSETIGALLRSWNDALDDRDRQQLWRYIPVIDSDGVVISAGVMGTAGSAEIEDIRAWMACDWLVRSYCPAWLRLAGLGAQADRLAGLDEVTAVTLLPARAVIDAVRRDAAAVGATGGDAAWDAAWDAVGAAGGAAAGVAAVAAGAAAWAAAGDAAGAAAWVAARVALRPTVVELQGSAHDLIGRMIAAGTEVPA